MSALTDDPKRKTVPRWRSFEASAAMGLLDSPTPKEPASFNRQNLDRQLLLWRLERSVGFGGDLLGRAFVASNEEVGAEVAEWLLEQAKPVPKPLRLLALKVLGRDDVKGESGEQELVQRDLVVKNIQATKKRLRAAPREAAAWMDLAREYAALGQDLAARRPVSNALALAPDNRWILRTAARFFIHIRDPETAADLLKRSLATRSDPWLMAAEIACSSLAEQEPDSVKLGRSVISRRSVLPQHYSELATVLGTLELESGAHKRARKFFQRGLDKPTENAVAQVEWASRFDHRISIPKWALEVPKTYEASAWSNLIAGRWSEATRSAYLWLADEPFSARAAVFGSWASMFAEGDYKEAAKFTEQGLLATPGQPVLLNNQAVAYAHLGKLNEAEDALDLLDQLGIVGRAKVAYSATKGLLAYRRGRVEEGERLYKKAASLAADDDDNWMELLAVLHHASEVRTGDIHLFSELLAKARQLAKKLSADQRNLADRFARISDIDL